METSYLPKFATFRQTASKWLRRQLLTEMVVSPVVCQFLRRRVAMFARRLALRPADIMATRIWENIRAEGYSVGVRTRSDAAKLTPLLQEASLTDVADENLGVCGV